MNKKREALRMALEALHGFIPYLPLKDEAQCGRYDQAITAIKEALAQPEKDISKIGCVNHDCDKCKAQPEQEPVAWMVTSELQDGTKNTYPLTGRFKDVKDVCDFGNPVPLYTTQPQRKPLTDEQINKIADEYLVDYRIPAGCAWNFARDIEAAHGIKE